MKKHPKPIKELLREFRIKAYERELHRALTKLDTSFDQWRNGEISSGELSHRIHQYDRGPLYELLERYNRGSQDMSVAYAIVVGILERDEIPPELLTAIEGPLDLFQSMKDSGELKEPE